MKQLTYLLIFLVIYSCNTGNQKSDNTGARVYIQKTDSGYELIRNGSPFYIRGAGGNGYLAALAETGGNTLRVYDTVNLKSILDEAYRYDIAVIVDISIPPHHQKYDYYADELKNRQLKEKVRALVSQYKDHPALLMWNLGNELYYPFVLRKNNFIRTFNELVGIIKAEDPDHPVSTALAGVGRMSAVSTYLHSPRLDLLAYNIFSDSPNLFDKIKQIAFITGKKPFYISEYGADGPWESKVTSWWVPVEHNTAEKTEQIIQRYHFMENNKPGECLGTLLFFWGNKHERTYTWFSLFLEDKKSESLKTLRQTWTNQEKDHENIGLQQMLVEKMSSFDNIVFEPNQMKETEILLRGTDSDSLTVRWVMYPEAWNWPWWLRQDTARMDYSPIKKIERFITVDKTKATFLTPENEGAYRIFAYVFDREGYYATANIPFYILSQDEKR